MASKSLQPSALPIPSTTLAGGFQEEPSVKCGKVQHQGKASDGSLWPRKLPAFEAMSDIQLKFYIPPFSGDGRKEVKAMVTVS